MNTTINQIIDELQEIHMAINGVKDRLAEYCRRIRQMGLRQMGLLSS